MSMEPRYAIYFVPGTESPLYRFGAAVLGYDCYTGRDIAPSAGVDAPSWAAIVREPRVYGFHATLKAPFRLAKGLHESDLVDAASGFAECQSAVLGGDLAVRALGSFIALVPAAACPDIDRLARACVRAFDRFRAPMPAEDRARRLAAGLTPRQVEHLDRWGYPYVFDDFRFHMTLTGPLAPPERERTLALLCEKFEQARGARALRIDRIVIARQDDKSAPFGVIAAAALGHSALRPYAYSF
jgi:putative phosphonate metabolism protein